MGRRQRRRQRAGQQAKEPVTTTDYTDDEGNVLTVRDRLSPKTVEKIKARESTPGSSQDDRDQRRAEMLFERLVVRWTIAELPLDSQRELLGRYRMANTATRQWVNATLARHFEQVVDRTEP
jgi:hypothetical protein